MSDSTSDDLVLIERSRAGDRTAFDDLVTKYEKRAYQFAFRLTQSHDQASDIVADAFVRVYNALGNFKAQAAFTTWLYRIITNCYLDSKKRDKSKFHVSIDQTVSADGGGEFERQYASDQAPDQDFERAERERLIQSALTKLPDYQKAMLIMYHVDSLSYEDIAETLDLPIGTVKSRLNRARVSLRELLQRDVELFQL